MFSPSYFPFTVVSFSFIILTIFFPSFLFLFLIAFFFHFHPFKTNKQTNKHTPSHTHTHTHTHRYCGRGHVARHCRHGSHWYHRGFCRARHSQVRAFNCANFPATSSFAWSAPLFFGHCFFVLISFIYLFIFCKTLSNYIAGWMLLVTRPFHAGSYITIGKPSGACVYWFFFVYFPSRLMSPTFVDGLAGIVDKMDNRYVYLRGKTGVVNLIPNSYCLTNVIQVKAKKRERGRKIGIGCSKIWNIPSHASFFILIYLFQKFRFIVQRCRWKTTCTQTAIWPPPRMAT